MASVDVIVPCYQYGHFLRDCAASVLTQDVSDHLRQNARAEGNGREGVAERVNG